MADHRFSSLDRLIQQANRTSARKPDSLDLLATMIQLATADGADPYLVLGVLVEGAVQTVSRHIPAERQPEVTEQLRQLLAERLQAHGLG